MLQVIIYLGSRNSEDFLVYFERANSILIVISTRKCASRESQKYRAPQVMLYFGFAQVGRLSG